MFNKNTTLFFFFLLLSGVPCAQSSPRYCDYTPPKGEILHRDWEPPPELDEAIQYELGTRVQIESIKLEAYYENDDARSADAEERALMLEITRQTEATKIHEELEELSDQN